MRMATINQRAHLIVGSGAVDIEKASNGRFGPQPSTVYDQWDAVRDWAATAALPEPAPFKPTDLGSPSPAPRQVFGIGLNYADHAAESGLPRPTGAPPVFTKFPSCITGPYGDIPLPADGHNDWEIELVVIIGRPAHHVAAGQAWSHVAGLAAGQDISERILQMASTPPQFSLGKSFPAFGPIGPWLVTTDELTDPDDLELGCAVNGESVQRGRTRDLIYGVPELIEMLSRSTPLLPGDAIFTGTPAGVGMGRNPQRWLAPGDELTSYIEGIGEMRHRCVPQSTVE
jgi:2-keto-4-pentenoate hydratase/2-oxohepta-3-ene-1,7-dioic acid hydratase in catechol pathway